MNENLHIEVMAAADTVLDAVESPRPRKSAELLDLAAKEFVAVFTGYPALSETDRRTIWSTLYEEARTDRAERRNQALQAPREQYTREEND